MVGGLEGNFWAFGLERRAGRVKQLPRVEPLMPTWRSFNSNQLQTPFYSFSATLFALQMQTTFAQSCGLHCHCTDNCNQRRDTSQTTVITDAADIQTLLPNIPQSYRM